MIEIKSRLSGKVIKTLNADTLVGADLRLTDLSWADLNRADLRGVHLYAANLSYAFLSRAQLSNADLGQAQLISADMTGADLSNAELTDVDLRYAQLYGVNLTNANVNATIFAFCKDLHEAKGLETIRHEGPSSLDAETQRASIEHLPDVFLRGVGYSNEEIETLRGLYGKAFRFYSCFISYARADDDFASRLYSDLQANNVTCWKDTEDMKGGDHWRSQIYEAIQLRDKVILVCSEQSLTRPAVIEEILEAIEREKKTKVKKLFPIRIDDFIFSDELAKIGKKKTATGDWPANWLSKVRAYNIPDFGGWKDHDTYQKGFERLLRDLKEATKK